MLARLPAVLLGGASLFAGDRTVDERILEVLTGDEKERTAAAVVDSVEADLRKVFFALSATQPGSDLTYGQNALDESFEALLVVAVERLGAGEAFMLFGQKSLPIQLNDLFAGCRVAERYPDQFDVEDVLRLLGRSRPAWLQERLGYELERLLVRKVTAEPSFSRSLVKRLGVIQADAQAIVVRAYLKAGSADRAVDLAEQIGWNEEADLYLLEAAGHLGAQASADDQQQVVERVIRYLGESQSSMGLRHAARAIDKLQADEAIPELIELLLLDDRLVQGAANRTLRSLTGLAYPAVHPLWSTWYKQEDAKFDQRVPLLLDQLDDEELSVTSAALREIAAIQIRRREVLKYLEYAMTDARPEVRVQTCQALARLGTAGARALLECQLDDPNDDVFHAATAALAILERGAGSRPNPR